MPPIEDLPPEDEDISTPPDGQEPIDERRDPARVRLTGGGALILETEGFRLIQPRGLNRSPFHAYDSVTHVYLTGRVLLIGTEESLLSIRHEDFANAEPGPVGARQALLARIGARPNGRDQLTRMAEVDALGRRRSVAWVVWATVVLCLLGTGFQLSNPMVDQVGSFLPDLFGRGEYWRGITTHFMHDLSPMPRLLRPLLPMFVVLPIHLAVNVGGLLVLGHLVERPLGSWRTACILGASALGTVFGILAFGHLIVVGASGLVSGLAGAMLATELHHAASIPAYWRLPRRIFIAVIAIQFCILDPLLAHYVAGGAHLGGFAGGYIAAWALGAPSLASLTPTPPLRLGALCAAALVLVGFFGALPLARGDIEALEKHAARLIATRDAYHLYRQDNAAAWLLATEGGASQEGLELAVALADRAATNTARMFPGILDTLAEALFQSGDPIGAVYTIDEAIELAPHEPYYFEQRRRFTGERAPDDRPPPPGTEALEESLPGDGPDAFPFDPDVPRITI